MRGKIRPSPKTDMQSRLRHVQERIESIEKSKDVTDVVASIKDLAWAVAYIAMIVEKHLATGKK